MSVIAELEHVSKSYGQIKALDNVTLKVRKREIFTLIGPNGSGKTTLLKILACIKTPDSGNVYINGEKIEDRNRNRAKLMVKLEGYENRPAKKLSGGEQQRVSLARALALNTPLLLLDEPTANLDPKTVSIIEEVIRQVNQQKGTTIIMATHNIFQAEQTAQKAALLLNGRIVEMGTINEILRRKSKNLTKFARLENIFSGTSEILEEGTSRIKLDEGIAIETALRKSGRITVFIRPEDIILSKKRFESSARNIFEGKIVEISDLGPLVKLKVDAGKEFIAQITKKSFVEMGLNVGSQIYLTFKASSVQMV